MNFRCVAGIVFAVVVLHSMTPVVAQDKCPAPSCAEVANMAAGASMLIYPATGVQPLLAAPLPPGHEIYYYANEVIDVYDAPDGRVIGVLDNPFTYVSSLRRQDRWTEINPNQWVQSQYLETVRVSQFAGVMLTDDLAYPLAWILEDARPVATPGAEPSDQDIVIPRYTQVNFHEAADVNDIRWYQVGPGRWLPESQLGRVSLMARPEQIDTYRWISVDLDEQTAVAYEGNRPVFATLVSTGTSDRQTGTGLFHIYASYKRVTLNGAAGIPDWYYLEDVPWMMYYDENIGFHGVYWHDRFGYPYSHGCVNLSLTDASWLYQWSQADADWAVERDLGTTVFVFHSR